MYKSDCYFTVKEMTIPMIQKIIFLFILNKIIFVDSKNCIEMYKKCDKASNNCQLDIIIMKKMCGDFRYDDSIFNGCERANEINCKAAIKTMSTKHSFKDCNCVNDYISSAIDQRFCNSIWRMLHAHPCNNRPPLYLPESGSRRNNARTREQKPTEIELDKLSNDKNDKEYFPSEEYNAIMINSLRVTLGSLGLFSEINTPKSSSCLIRQERCNDDQNCYNTWNTFKQQCQFQSCDKTGDLCVASYQDLRQYGMFECICVPYYQFHSSNMNTCLQIQSSLIDNKCLAFLNNRVMYQTLTFTTTDNTRNTDSTMEILSKQLQTITKETPNCLTSYQICMQSSQCLQRYIEVEKYCSKCDDNTKCLKAVRFFHQKPDIISLNSIRCLCDHSSLNDSCHIQKRVFQPTCVTKSPRHIINCLHLMIQCLNETTCLDSYTVFSELCTPRLNGTLTCPSNYIRCLDAYRSIWGSVLTSECNCEDSETIHIASNKYPWAQNPLHICQFFKSLLSRLYCIYQDEKYQKKKNRNTDSKSSIKVKNDPCSILSKQNVPTDGLIRIDAASTCPVICKCGETCQTLPCSSMSNFSQSICNLFNLSEQRCNCSTKSISCLLLKSENESWMYKNSGYKIMITYNEREFNLIRNLNLIPGIQTILSSLNYLMTISTGLKHCRLSFEGVQNNRLTFVLEINIQRTNSRNNRFAVRYWPQSKEERMGHLIAECVLSAKLLQLMINRKYPEIQHSLPLSILQKADIIVPPQLLQISESVKSPHLGPSNAIIHLKFTTTIILVAQCILILLN